MKEIPAKLVQELRAKTGVGLMKCKKALQESDGDIAQAIERLRQKGELLAAAGGNSEKEKEIEMGRDDLADKPEAIKEKIVQGRIEKRLRELCLMDQAYIRDQSISVEELVKQAIAQLGENIRVRRFVRYVLGEGITQQGDNSTEQL
jgi:translation elongation factor EF-Ts